MSEKKSALLIASSEYDDPYFRRLEAPGQDVEALSRVLRDPTMGAFSEVKVLVNEPKDTLTLAIEDFFDNRNTEDLLLLYFSGHGVKDADGRLYYAAKTTLHKRLVSTGVPAYAVNDLIAKCRSRRKILVLDCCYSGAFSKAILTKGDQTVGVTEQFEQGRGLITLTASDSFQYSFEEEGAGAGSVSSVFTHALVQGIETGSADRDGDQLVSLDELYHYAFERVRIERPEQTPRRSGEVEGDIFIARNPCPLRPCELPPLVREAIESRFSSTRLEAVEELGGLLGGRNRGLALAALEALRKLTEDDSRRVASAAQECLNAFDQIEQYEREVSQLKAGQDRLERQKAEQERLRQEKAQAEKLAREEAQRERHAAEMAEQERFTHEDTKNALPPVVILDSVRRQQRDLLEKLTFIKPWYNGRNAVSLLLVFVLVAVLTMLLLRQKRDNQGESVSSTATTPAQVAKPSTAPPPAPVAKPKTPQRIRVSGTVLNAKLVYSPSPKYPQLAKSARIQGTVRFEAVIGKDGTVRSLKVLSGHPLLVPAAMDAVKKWRYQPTLVSGEPVEVVTEIDVQFHLEG